MSKTSRFMHVPVTQRHPREYETIEYVWDGVKCVGVHDQGDVFVKPLEWPSGRVPGRKWERRATLEARRRFQQAHAIRERDEQRARERARAVNSEYFSQPHVQARLQRERAERERAIERQRQYEEKQRARAAAV